MYFCVLFILRTVLFSDFSICHCLLLLSLRFIRYVLFYMLINLFLQCQCFITHDRYFKFNLSYKHFLVLKDTSNIDLSTNRVLLHITV